MQIKQDAHKVFEITGFIGAINLHLTSVADYSWFAAYPG